MKSQSYIVILIYYLGYVAIKDSKYIKIYNVNLLYLILRNAIDYFEEIYKNKFFTLVHTNESKKKL